jgi:DNA-binding transcriptional LysR family regulator
MVSQLGEMELLQLVGSSKLDLGILTCPREIPSNVMVTHRMEDQFSIITSHETGTKLAFDSPSKFRKWAASQSWLLPPQQSGTRRLIDEWAAAQKVDLNPIMELENFDLMIQLASMGMGTALIPRRSLSGFRRKRLLSVIIPPLKLRRQLVVITPKHTKCPEHVSRFVEGILFS